MAGLLNPMLGMCLQAAIPGSHAIMKMEISRGPVGTMNVGYRFGQSAFIADLALRYERVFSNNVGQISSVGLRFAISLGIGRGKYQD